jgi:hypothetical protein
MAIGKLSVETGNCHPPKKRIGKIFEFVASELQRHIKK